MLWEVNKSWQACFSLNVLLINISPERGHMLDSLGCLTWTVVQAWPRVFARDIHEIPARFTRLLRGPHCPQGVTGSLPSRGLRSQGGSDPPPTPPLPLRQSRSACSRCFGPCPLEIQGAGATRKGFNPIIFRCSELARATHAFSSPDMALKVRLNHINGPLRRSNPAFQSV